VKKVAIFLICFACGLCCAFGLLYKIDIARMANNKEVVFSNWGIDYNINSADSTEETDNELYMKADEETLTTRGMKVTIVNNTYNDIAFGDYYAIERFIGGHWKKLNYIVSEEPDWNDMTYIIEGGGSAEVKFYWEDMYGELSKGNYRIEKLYIDSSDSEQINSLYCYFKI
jgi:hypothetical protein